ncbi:phage tail family protein [Bacillus sp. Y1]|nr:phage tail family protein [Bacillus sp. Y1]
MIKTLDNFKIVTQAGVTYDMAEDFGVLVRSFSISSARPEIITEKVENTNGNLRMGKSWGSRQLTAVCSLFATDYIDTSLLRSELYAVLMSRDEFYIIVDSEPGKRWKVEVVSEFTPEAIGTYGDFTVEFVCHKGVAESVATTQTAQTFDVESWQLGQGLTADDLAYTHSTTSFRIFNAGGIPINPRETPLVITFTGASTNLKIANTTTGDEWQYTGTTASGDTVRLDGIRSTKNGLSIFRNTNRKLITMATGWNDFVITGASGAFTISFDHRFYYL